MDWFKNVLEIQDVFIEESLATLYMFLVTSAIAGFFGLLQGIHLTLLEPGGLYENKRMYAFLDKLVNVGRSIPFIILLALVAPLTKLIVGTTIGNTAAILPLSLGTIPFFARQVQSALSEVKPGIIEASKAMGLTGSEIVFQVMLPEARESLIRAAAITAISLIGLTTMAGAIGAGGLGKVAIAYGYNRFKNDIVIVATVLLLLLVFIVQGIANLALQTIKKRKENK
ncbi:methionine ABC transporter permease [Guggenheimella bovis]